MTLWLCAKFSVAFPYLGPLAFGARSPAAETAAAARASTHPITASKTEAANENMNVANSFRSKSPRDQGAAPPVYLQVLVFVPVCVAFFVACSRYHDHRHAGFDIISGSILGIFFAYVAFRMYHLPLPRSEGWAWAARSRRHAFFRGVGYADLTVTEGWAAADPEEPVDAPGVSEAEPSTLRGEEQV